MRNFVMLATTASILLSGCSAANQSGGSQSTSAEVATTDAAAPATKGGPEPVKVALPQLAYSYKLGFRVPGDKLGAAQDAHRALCDKLGATRCQMLALERGNAEDSTGTALLKLRVASTDARAFQDSLTKAVAQSGGRIVDTNVAAEDVSKNMVDASARIAQRELLVSRLTEILRTRTGKVSELVEAERSVAQAQEELDQAKAWLAELQGRVAMSDFEIRYTAIAPSASAGTVGSQIGEATQGSASTFLIGLRALLVLAIYLLPWGVLAIPVVLGIRWLNRRAAERKAKGKTLPSDA
jgi:hypothetical protein